MTTLLARLKPRWGIASVLTMSVVCVIALLITLITALDIRRERDVYRDGLEQRGLLPASGLNDLLANSLYFSKVSSLEEIADAVSSHPDVTYVQVLGPDGRLLVTPEGRDGVVGDANHVFGLRAFHSPDPLLSFSGNRLDVAGPVKIGTETVGVIQFGIESGALGARIREIVFQHIWQGLILSPNAPKDGLGDSP